MWKGAGMKGENAGSIHNNLFTKARITFTHDAWA